MTPLNIALEPLRRPEALEVVFPTGEVLLAGAMVAAGAAVFLFFRYRLRRREALRRAWEERQLARMVSLDWDDPKGAAYEATRIARELDKKRAEALAKVLEPCKYRLNPAKACDRMQEAVTAWAKMKRDQPDR